MFLRAPEGVLRLTRCARRSAWRNGPFARAVSPSRAACCMNSANSGTGSGLHHSPAAQAWYQPTEPLLASLTSAFQLRNSTVQSKPGARPPSSRRLPSGKVAAMLPLTSALSMRSRILPKPGATSRASIPGRRAKLNEPSIRSRPRGVVGMVIAPLCRAGRAPTSDALAASPQSLEDRWASSARSRASLWPIILTG